MDHQYRKNGARNIYLNDQMRAYVECSPNQSKKLCLIDLSIEQSTNTEDSGKVMAVSVSEFARVFLCSSALLAHAYKMVITIVCVQIDNCFCNT